MGLGPVMLDIAGTEPTAEERERLRHPLVGGVILFSRNFHDPEQLQHLVAELHGLREPRLLVAVDQEGGRVQRFRDGFTLLPAAARYGEHHNIEPVEARRLAYDGGWVMARELRAFGVDFSFAPVLDLDHGCSSVIGDRAFHAEPHVVTELATAWVDGMRAAGMAAVGKHFPGHGGVAADSHLELPVDDRPLETLLHSDLRPFKALSDHGLAAVMPAHVVYSAVDEQPAGFSRYWLQTVLRERLGFQGLVFSDDLAMAGAQGAGGPADRANAAVAAGCDMVLVCNEPESAAAVLEGLRWETDPLSHARLARMHGREAVTREALKLDAAWRESAERLLAMAEDPTPELALRTDTTD
ncbi:MAG: beta-N-acetylhexosaminidase [Pseudomonadota bacterium]